ncbi:MAG: DUF4288 domain-containing protein [Planctomycetota bacterium]
MSTKYFSARLVFVHVDLPPKVEDGKVYEERIVLLRAESFEAAIELAEECAHAYCEGLDGVEPLDLVQVYELADDPEEDGAEIYSLMRSSPLPPADYLDRFFDTGDEHQGTAG